MRLFFVRFFLGRFNAFWVHVYNLLNARASGIAFSLLSDLTISGFLPLRKYSRRFDVRLNFAVLSGSLSCFANPRLTLNPLFFEDLVFAYAYHLFKMT